VAALKSNNRRGAQALLRESNLSAILRLLHSDSQLSRAQLAKLTYLNKSTVSSLTEELLDRGLIREAGLDNSGAGRPAILLEVNPQAGHIIGLQVDVGFILVLLTDFAGDIIWRSMQETDPLGRQEETLAQALDLVDEAIAINQSHGKRLFGLGLTLPGMVDVEKACLVFSPNLQWRNVPMGPVFQDHTGLPFFVENDANAAALGEHYFGIARRVQNFVFIVAGVGVGGGLFLNGSLYRGAGGLAGEIGHSSFSGTLSRPCRCGSHGCWENSGNEDALKHRVQALLNVGRNSIIPRLMAKRGTALTPSLIIEAADAGDAVALKALAETGEALGVGISNLANIFNPESIVLGGTLSKAGNYLLPAIERAVERYALAEARQQTQIALSAFGTEAIVMGSVALVTEAVLKSPTSVQ
jgi:glucokinase-like ROK family protein